MFHQKMNLQLEKELRFINWAAVARRYRIHRTAIYHVLAGRSQSPRIRQIIANATGLRLEQLWPEHRPPRAA